MIAWVAAAWKFRDVGYIAVIAVLFGLWQWDRADLASAKEKAEAAVIAAQKKADALANELVIAQAIAMGVTQTKVTQYVDRIQSSPDDAARNIAGSLGVRDLILGAPK
jgi:hypothetical protein